MDDKAKDELRRLNNAFYEAAGASFSASRSHAWPGWDRVVRSFPDGRPLAVLDVACGNMRFEKFATGRLGEGAVRFTCVDSCRAMAVEGDGWDFVEMDVLVGLEQPNAWAGLTRRGPFDAAVSFGFMHHVPGYDQRARVLQALVGSVRPGGVVAVSLWRFASVDKMAQKARASTARAAGRLDARLEEGDYLLGWEGDESALRYCHHFSAEEADSLVCDVASEAQLIDRFKADGRTGSLNEYLVFRRLAP